MLLARWGEFCCVQHGNCKCAQLWLLLIGKNDYTKSGLIANLTEVLSNLEIDRNAIYEKTNNT